MKRTRFLLALLVAGLVGLTASCGTESSPTGVAPAVAPSPDLIGGVLGTVTNTVQGLLLQCTPLPYASNSKLIGPSGGTLQIGPHTLTIPAGALTQSVQITGEAPSDKVNSVRLYPEGLQFARSASLTMSYSNCNLLGRLAPKRIAYTTDGLQILSYLLSLDNLFAQSVTGQVNHFSRYAVAW